jgi:hypothetical protein
MHRHKRPPSSDPPEADGTRLVGAFILFKADQTLFVPYNPEGTGAARLLPI